MILCVRVCFPSSYLGERGCSNIVRWTSPAKSIFQHCLNVLVLSLPSVNLSCCRDVRHLLRSSHPYSLAKRSGVVSVLLHSFLNFLLMHQLQLADAVHDLTIEDLHVCSPASPKDKPLLTLCSGCLRHSVNFMKWHTFADSHSLFSFQT